MFNALTSAWHELAGEATVARAGRPALPILFLYPCRARARVPCLMVFRCGKNAYRIFNHITYVFTQPLCARVTSLLCACSPVA
jgi:hypothetical protein